MENFILSIFVRSTEVLNIFEHMYELAANKVAPVTNAFCSWPLSPVFQGPMVATALLRHGKSQQAIPASNSRPAAGRTVKYSHLMDVNHLDGRCGELPAAAGGATSLGVG